MNVSDLTQLISTVGFPIVMCLWLVYSQQKIAEKHEEEVDKLRETVENNTKVMIKLCAKLGVEIE